MSQYVYFLLWQCKVKFAVFWWINQSWCCTVTMKSYLFLNCDNGILPGFTHKVLTYIEYRAVSGVFPTIDPPPPLHPASVSSPAPKAGEVHTRRAVRGWGVNISEDARHLIGLLQYNPSTVLLYDYHTSWGIPWWTIPVIALWWCNHVPFMHSLLMGQASAERKQTTVNFFGVFSLPKTPEAKSKFSDWGDKVDSGIELSMVNVLESTLEWT
jgi:hypothetical protein